ncbi:MAG: oligosaccharide flippase family protein [Turicibacter sp.]
MKQKSITKNYLYNLMLNGINLIFPLVTAPYLSQVLGALNIGKVNYAMSIVGWFILFASFGIPRYGMREISKNRKDKEQLTTIFWNLLNIQWILSLLVMVVYLGIIFYFQMFASELALYVMMMTMILLNIFSIDWFYQGIEEYGFLTFRNFIFKIINIILIFWLIQNPADYLMYGLISIIGLSINNVFNFIHAKKFLTKQTVKLSFWFYLNEMKTYFYITLIISLYTKLDQTLIGNLSQSDLALYLRSKVFLSIGFSVVNSLITVLIPRAAYLAKTNYEAYKSVLNATINYIYLLAFPCGMGLFLLSDELMLLFGGKEFLPGSVSLKIISILLVITSISIYQIEQILLPHQKEKAVVGIQISAAIFSVVLNSILIPRYSFIGASITWVLTEAFITVIETIYIHVVLKELNIHYVTRSTLNYIFATLLMALFIVFIKLNVASQFLIMIVSLVGGPIIYFLVLIIGRESVVTESIKTVISKVMHKA